MIKRISINLTEEQHRLLKVKAAEQQTTIKQLVLDALGIK